MVRPVSKNVFQMSFFLHACFLVDAVQAMGVTVSMILPSPVYMQIRTTPLTRERMTSVPVRYHKDLLSMVFNLLNSNMHRFDVPGCSFHLIAR